MIVQLFEQSLENNFLMGRKRWFFDIKQGITLSALTIRKYPFVKTLKFKHSENLKLCITYR